MYAFHLAAKGEREMERLRKRGSRRGRWKERDGLWSYGRAVRADAAKRQEAGK